MLVSKQGSDPLNLGHDLNCHDYYYPSDFLHRWLIMSFPLFFRIIKD